MTIKRWFYLCSVTALGLCGCGGSGGGGGSHSSTVVLNLNGLSVAFAAFQDGSAAWKPVTPSGGKLTLTVTNSAGKYGVAVVDAKSNVTIFEATTAELTSIYFPTQTSSATVSGTISDLTGEMNLAAVDNFTQESNGSYTFPCSLTPTWDLVAQVVDANSNPLTMAVRRSLNAAATTQNFDATSSDFQAVVPFTLGVSGPSGASSLNGFVDLRTPNGTVCEVDNGQGTTSLPFGALAVSQRAAGDEYEYGAFNSGPTGGSVSQDAIAVAFAKTPGNFRVTAPSLAAQGTVTTVASGSKYLAQASWTPDPSAKLFEFLLQKNAAGAPLFEALVTSGWLGGGAAKSYTSPDLSSVTGWNSSWDLTSNMIYNYEGLASSWPDSAWFAPTLSPPDGSTATVWLQSGGGSAADVRSLRDRITFSSSFLRQFLPGRPRPAKKTLP